MTLPIPEFGEFAFGFGTCGALIVGAVLVRHAWPAIKGVFVKPETYLATEFDKAIKFFDFKISGLSTTFAGAVNAIRGDVGGLQTGIAYLEDRVFTLEKAVGIANPTVDPTPVQTGPAPVVTPASLDAKVTALTK